MVCIFPDYEGPHVELVGKIPYHLEGQRLRWTLMGLCVSSYWEEGESLFLGIAEVALYWVEA